MEINEQQNSGFSPGQLAELESVRLQRVQAEAEVMRLQKELSETQRQEREKRQKQIIRDAAASTAKFHDLSVVEHIARADYDLAFDDQGNGTGLVNGQRKPLADVFRQIALANEHLVDGRSLRYLKDAEERKEAEKA